MAHVLVIESDPAVRSALCQALAAEGHDAIPRDHPEDGELGEPGEADLVLLDLRPREGFELIRRIRDEAEVPVVVLSLEDRKSAKIRALDAGADDFLAKPFDMDELLARVRAVLRRAPRTPSRSPVLATGDLEIDLDARQVRRGGSPIHLTPTELGLLEELVSNPGRLLTHQHLLQRVWGPNYGTESHYLRVYVAQLRRKLGDNAANPRLITTEPGIGYRWIAEPA